jgi:dTDP-glucose 4,6-dehydratase
VPKAREDYPGGHREGSGPSRILVCGGAGFIGSAFARMTLDRYPGCSVVVLDKLTYAGNLANLEPVAADPRFGFIQGDICDADVVARAMRDADAVVNFAAETHVDRSIHSPAEFIATDVVGTQTLLEAARSQGLARFVQVSTDEVYGSIDDGSFTEDSPLDPSSPYSASKAGGDLQVIAYQRTYGLPAMITRGSNTYGPYQYPEKLIPLFITNLMDGRKVPLYGDGGNVRDWLFVDDHVTGIDTVLRSGEPGRVYNIGGSQERTNVQVTGTLLSLMGVGQEMIERVADRPAHDRRYSLDSTVLGALGWSPSTTFEEGLARTVDWYKENEAWWRPIKDGDHFATWQRANYDGREDDTTVDKPDMRGRTIR